MISIPAKHALKALFVLSEQKRGTFVPVSELARASNVPSSYLSKLVKQLATASLLVTRKGPTGGVALPKKKVSFYQVCEALQDPITYDTCLLSKKACSKNSPCPVHPKWSKERERFKSFLRKQRI